MTKGETKQLCPDDHVTLLKRDNGIDSRPNIGFRIIMALRKPKLEDHYNLLHGELLGAYSLYYGGANLQWDVRCSAQSQKSQHKSDCCRQNHQISSWLQRQSRLGTRDPHYEEARSCTSSSLSNTDNSPTLFNFTTHSRRRKNKLSFVTLSWNSWNAGHSMNSSRHLFKRRRPRSVISSVKYYQHWNICTNVIMSHIEISSLLYVSSMRRV